MLDEPAPEQLPLFKQIVPLEFGSVIVCETVAVGALKVTVLAFVALLNTNVPFRVPDWPSKIWPLVVSPANTEVPPDVSKRNALVELFKFCRVTIPVLPTPSMTGPKPAALLPRMSKRSALIDVLASWISTPSNELLTLIFGVVPPTEKL